MRSSGGDKEFYGSEIEKAVFLATGVVLSGKESDSASHAQATDESRSGDSGFDEVHGVVCGGIAARKRRAPGRGRCGYSGKTASETVR